MSIIMFDPGPMHSTPVKLTSADTGSIMSIAGYEVMDDDPHHASANSSPATPQVAATPQSHSSPVDHTNSRSPSQSEAGNRSPHIFMQDVEQSLVARQQQEIQLLLAELKVRDRELNDTVASHHHQLAMWERDKQFILKLQNTCQHLAAELKQQKQLVARYQSQVMAGDGDVFQDCTKHPAQTSDMMENIQTVVNVKGQLEARVKELTAAVKSKEASLEEVHNDMQKLQAKLKLAEIQSEDNQTASSRLIAYWQQCCTDLKEEKDKLLRACQEKDGQLHKATTQLQDSLQQALVLQQALRVSCEQEKTKDEFICSLRCQHERCALELNQLRQLYRRQHREVTLLQLSAETSRSTHSSADHCERDVEVSNDLALNTSRSTNSSGSKAVNTNIVQQRPGTYASLEHCLERSPVNYEKKSSSLHLTDEAQRGNRLHLTGQTQRSNNLHLTDQSQKPSSLHLTDPAHRNSNLHLSDEGLRSNSLHLADEAHRTNSSHHSDQTPSSRHQVSSHLTDQGQKNNNLHLTDTRNRAGQMDEDRVTSHHRHPVIKRNIEPGCPITNLISEAQQDAGTTHYSTAYNLSTNNSASYGNSNISELVSPLTKPYIKHPSSLQSYPPDSCAVPAPVRDNQHKDNTHTPPTSPEMPNNDSCFVKELDVDTEAFWQKIMLSRRGNENSPGHMKNSGSSSTKCWLRQAESNDGDGQSGLAGNIVDTNRSNRCRPLTSQDRQAPEKRDAHCLKGLRMDSDQERKPCYMLADNRMDSDQERKPSYMLADNRMDSDQERKPSYMLTDNRMDSDQERKPSYMLTDNRMDSDQERKPSYMLTDNRNYPAHDSCTQKVFRGSDTLSSWRPSSRDRNYPGHDLHAQVFRSSDIHSSLRQSSGDGRRPESINTDEHSGGAGSVSSVGQMGGAGSINSIGQRGGVGSINSIGQRGGVGFINSVGQSGGAGSVNSVGHTGDVCSLPQAFDDCDRLFSEKLHPASQHGHYKESRQESTATQDKVLMDDDIPHKMMQLEQGGKAQADEVPAGFDEKLSFFLETPDDYNDSDPTISFSRGCSSPANKLHRLLMESQEMIKSLESAARPNCQ